MTTTIPTTGADGAPSTITSLVTITGSTTYLTVQATTIVGSPGSSLNTENDAGPTGFFSNTGAVAGTFLAVGILIAGAVLGGLLFVRRRKRRRALDEDLRVAAGGAGDGGAGTSRFHDDIEDDDDFADSTHGGGGGGGGGFKGPPMTQYNPVSLPAGAAAAGAGAGAYYANHSSQGHSGTGHSRSPSGQSHFMGSMAAAGAGAGAGAGAAAYGRSLSSAPSYYTGPNQAYLDQYGIAQGYADRNSGPFSDYPNDRLSGDGSGESGGHFRRDSE